MASVKRDDRKYCEGVIAGSNKTRCKNEATLKILSYGEIFGYCRQCYIQLKADGKAVFTVVGEKDT